MCCMHYASDEAFPLSNDLTQVEITMEHLHYICRASQYYHNFPHPIIKQAIPLHIRTRDSVLGLILRNFFGAESKVSHFIAEPYLFYFMLLSFTYCIVFSPSLGLKKYNRGALWDNHMSNSLVKGI